MRSRQPHTRRHAGSRSPVKHRGRLGRATENGGQNRTRRTSSWFLPSRSHHSFFIRRGEFSPSTQRSLQSIGWRLELEGLPRASVQLQRDLVEFGLGELREAGPFG